MPLPLLAEGFNRGLYKSPYVWTVGKAAAVIGVVALLKIYFEGAKCRSERVMHGKVVMVTGGTSGIGAAVVQELASRGAQIIILTHHAPSDPFLVDYIEDLRTLTNNELIYAEQVDLSSLHSIRLFATKWVDNAPPRRLDMVILCASVMTPYFGTSQTTVDGLEAEWEINYLSNFHLLSILSPAIRAQPADRDVRILFSTCSSYIGGELDLNVTTAPSKSGGASFARSKLAVMTFAHAFQKHLDAYKRPDKQPNNARAFIVDPGYCRTPGMRHWLSGGLIWGLFLYLITWPIWWLVLKSSVQGAQSYLFAAMDAEYAQGSGGKIIKECREYQSLRPEVQDEEVAKTLWEFSEKQIEQLEKQGAVKRALAKKEAERQTAKENGTKESANAQASGGEKKPIPGSRKSRKAK
ncbi:putative oxidoreductase C19A8.06 [Exophiala dermatitidis]